MAGISFVLPSCNSTKYVPEGAYLLKKNEIYTDGKPLVNSEVKNFIIQRPNQKSLGLPLSLYFYNLGNKAYEKTYSEWLQKHPKTVERFKKVFSEKQLHQVGNSYASFQNWFLKGGEAPVVWSEKKSKQSAKKLQTYFFNEGYFNAEVTYSIDLKLKKASSSYHITKHQPTYLDKIKVAIDSKIVDSLYKSTVAHSFLQKGKRYRDENFRKEANRLTALFRNAGVYHFSKNQIGFYEIDTLAPNHKTNVLMKITDRLSEKDGTITSHPLQVQKISKIGIFTDYSYARKDELYRDTVHYNGYTFFSHDKLKYQPKTFLNAVFIEPGQIYKDSMRNLTRKHLKLLKNFKLVKIRYKEINDKELSASIVLTPMKKYAIGINTEAIHSNIKQLGFSGGFSFVNRNTFKGAEIFKLSFQGAVFDISNSIGNNEKPFNSWEIGADASLEMPRFILPLQSQKLISKRMQPKTVISVGTSFQKNIGLDKQKFTGIVDFSWTSSKTQKHTIELINTQYVKNLNKAEYFNVYSSEYQKLKALQEDFFPGVNLTTSTAIGFIKSSIDSDFKDQQPEDYQLAKNIEKRHEILTSDYVSPSVSYEYIYNSQSDFKDKHYAFFKGKISTSGNITSGISKTEIDGVKTFLDIPIAQFVRTDFEFKRFWKVSNSSVLAFRSFLGIALPYGNSSEIPFTNSYFIGGSSDIRAWKTYDLGPGSSKTGLEFNVGNFKLISSLEYRFDMTKSLKGALFVDAGNIWDITDSKLTKQDEKFIGMKSLKNAALGSGFGIRYDFNFLVLRLDLGFKTYEPYLTDNKWFRHYNFANAVLNIGINYPF